MSTRHTHYVRVPDPKNPDRNMDFEVADVVVTTGPDGKQTAYSCAAKKASPRVMDDGSASGSDKPTRLAHMTRLQGDTNNFFKAESLDAIVFTGPDGKQTILNMKAKGTSRKTHLEKIQNPDNPSEYMTVRRTDAITFTGPNGKQMIINAPKPRQDARTAGDLTNPPVNTDPDPYMKWLDGGGPWTGDTPIDQGLLWWPKAAHSSGGPWYWYVPAQQPMAFSLYEDDRWINPNAGLYTWNKVAPPGGSVPPGLSGFQLLPNFPTIMLLEANIIENGGLYGAPIPAIGFSSLEDAIDHGNIGFYEWYNQAVPNNGFNSVSGAWGLLGGSSGNSAFGSPMTKPAPPADDGFNYLLGPPPPNIWQLTGLPQPTLKNPRDPNSGVPTAALAKQAAQDFAKYWNETSVSQNDLIQQVVGVTNSDQENAVNAIVWANYPGVWNFKTPFYLNTSGGHLRAFNAGLPVGLNFGYISVPFANSMIIAVAQLDPKIWDTTNFPPVRRHP